MTEKVQAVAVWILNPTALQLSGAKQLSSGHASAVAKQLPKPKEFRV